MFSEKNGKLESKLNISVIQSSKHVEEDKSDTLSYKCTVCILDSFELNYGPLSDECREKILKKPTKFLWKHFFDFWASFFIITPCIISFWRGTWDYAVIYLEKEAFHNDCVLANSTCLVIGILGTQTIQWSQYWIKKKLAGAYQPNSSPARFYFVSRVFSLVWGFCDIYMWKGIWDGIYCLFGMTVLESSIALVFGTTVLVASKAFRSALSLPVGIVIDDKKANCCAAQTFWDYPPSETYGRRFLDIGLSFFLEACVVLHWHGVWSLEDLVWEYLGHSKKITGWISLGAGAGTFLISFFLQFPFTMYCQRKDVSNFSKLLANFFVTVVGVIATVNTFRGYWYIMDVYLMPDHYEMSLLNGMLYGALLLYALHCGSSMHAGIIRDITQGTMIETCYTTYFFIKKINSKTAVVKQNGHLHEENGAAHLEVPLLVVSKTPTQVVPEDQNLHDRIDAGYLVDELVSDEDEDFEDGKEFEEKAKNLDMKV